MRQKTHTDGPSWDGPGPQALGDAVNEQIGDLVFAQLNRDVLLEYAHGAINIAQLYTAIGSPAGGKWVDPEPEIPHDVF